MDGFLADALPVPAFLAGLIALRALVRYANTKLDQRPAYHLALRAAAASGLACVVIGYLAFGSPTAAGAGFVTLAAALLVRACGMQRDAGYPIDPDLTGACAPGTGSAPAGGYTDPARSVS